MKKLILLAIFCCFCVSANVALADILVGSGGGWAPMPAPNQGGNPFWDNPSMDGQNQNIGFKLPGLGFPGNGQYWSIGGAPDNNVVFNGVGGGQTETLLLEIAGNAGINQLFAYNIAAPGQTIQIFAGGDAAVKVNNIAIPWAQYGFMLVGAGGKTFYSGSGHGEIAGDANSNFAFFRDPAQGGTWWVGIEDLAENIGAEGNLGDYQDMVVKISTVPIPSTALLLGPALVALALWRGRKQN